MPRQYRWLKYRKLVSINYTQRGLLWFMPNHSSLGKKKNLSPREMMQSRLSPWEQEPESSLPYLYCWWSLVLLVLAMNLSASFSRFREYSVSISAFFRKKSCRSWSSWTRISVCCSRHFCCSTSWARISKERRGREENPEGERVKLLRSAVR